MTHSTGRMLANAAHWLSPLEAAEMLGCSRDQLIGMVGDGRLVLHRLPSGDVAISSNDCSALCAQIPAQEAIPILITQLKETSMQSASNSATATLTLVPRQNSDANDVFARISDLIEETRAKLERFPMWLGVRDVKRVFGIDNRRLQELALNGFVRKAKLGETLQSKTLYSAADLDEVLSRLAAGKPPRSALRKGVNDAA